MKLAVMQPYIFPYLGYFQLVSAVDTFVFFDDVQFKRRSYITRNSILINDKPNTFSVPVQKGNRQDLINQIKLHKDEFENWKIKFLTTLKHAYSKAPFFEPVFELIKNIFNTNSSEIMTLTECSIEKTCGYLGIDTVFKSSSLLSYDLSGNGQEKILSICNLLKTDTYINAINGRNLYDAEEFEKKDVKLVFLDPEIEKYNQFSTDFTSHLSIIDIMMFLPPKEIAEHLRNYKLVTE